MKKSKSRLSWRMIILNLLLPLNLIILMLTLFVQIWFLQCDVNVEGLQAKRFLVEPLLKVLNDKNNEEIQLDGWINLVALEDGTIYYPDTSTVDLMNKMINPEASDPLKTFFSEMIANMPSAINIISFNYKGQKGVCLYNYNELPAALRVLQNPRYLINLFLVVSLLVLLGTGILLNLKRNISELIGAINRLRELDFDTPLLPRGENELSDVFVAFEQMRQDMNQQRKQGILVIMSITHDLKTPLTSIRGYLEAFLDGVIDPAEAMPITQILLNKTNLLDDRINEMLEFSKIVSGNCNSNGETFSVVNWLTDLNLYFHEESQLLKRNYLYKTDGIPDDITLSGFEKKLTRAVINLFDNACRYTDDIDTIYFSGNYDRDVKSLILRMEDSGSGVKEDNKERIFDLFYRKDKGRNTRGMGIGLASVKFMVELHNGTVSCLDSDLGGACFEIRLPIEKQ